MDYQPENLRRWSLPDSYMGASWPEHFVFLAQHRDSDTLTRSNFLAGLAAIGGESDTVLIIRESHWAVGWVEWIGIHQSDAKALREADEIAAALEDYPVVDEEHFSGLEWSEACDYWAGLSVRERAEFIRDAHCGASMFAARRDELPRDDNGALLQRLNGN